MNTKLLLFLVAIAIFLLESCTSLKNSNMLDQIDYNKIQDRIRLYEWTSFDVEYKSIEKKNVKYISDRGRVIVRNQPEKSACIAFFRPDNSFILISSDSAIYINTDYNEIDIFHKEKTMNGYSMYALLCGDVIGNTISHWGVFSPLTYWGTEVTPIKVSDVILDNRKKIFVKAKQKVKYCTSEACYYRYVPVNLYFDAVTGMPDSAIDASGEYRKAEIVKNINHENLQQLLDSIFDMKSERYAKYSVNRNDSNYINSNQHVIDEVFNEEVLNFPLVNVKTGDTTTLKNFEGWTLVVFWDRYSLAAMSKEAKQDLPVDNILFVSAMSDNVDFINRLSDTLNIDGLLYHAKFLNTRINTMRKIYMLSPSKEVVYKTKQNSFRIKPEEWYKAKQEYEQKHNIK